MPEQFSNPNEPLEDALPPRLSAELSRLYGGGPTVPPEMDAAILARAGAAFRRRSRLRPIVRWASGVAAAAALATIGLVIRASLHPAPARLAGDVNGDGRVDILDAYVLARRLAVGGKVDAAWDVNRDGAVDQKDIAWIAQAAVRLGDAK